MVLHTVHFSAFAIAHLGFPQVFHIEQMADESPSWFHETKTSFQTWKRLYLSLAISRASGDVQRGLVVRDRNLYDYTAFATGHRKLRMYNQH